MRIRNLILSFAALMMAVGLSAQTLEDAMSLSMRDYLTSARVVGVGSAMGAIGGDYGAVNINPANIGTFRSSYFTGSLGLNNIQTESTWRGGSATPKEANSFLSLPNIGFVSSGGGYNKWETINFGIGYNRVKSNTRYINTSAADYGSIVQRWAFLANEVGDPSRFDEFELLPAFETYALGIAEDEDGNIVYTSDYGNKDILNKEVYEEIKGGINEIALSFGANYDNKLMMGMNLGIPFYNNKVTRIYDESMPGEIDFYKGVSYEESYETSGFGFNMGLGLIYMPVYNVRIGVSFQSPTWFSLSDNYRTRTHFRYNDPNNIHVPEGTNTDYKSDPGYFDYRFSTPMRFGAQLGWIISRMGFVDVDVEYVDYGLGRFNMGSFKEDQRRLNTQIGQELGKALSIRAGGELALDEFRIRLGAGLQQDPYKNTNSFSPVFSGGLGFRAETFFIDLAYRYSGTADNYYPYVTYGDTYQPKLNNKYTNNIFILTVGFDL